MFQVLSHISPLPYCVVKIFLSNSVKVAADSNDVYKIFLNIHPLANRFAASIAAK
jgi:hypothetical protein